LDISTWHPLTVHFPIAFLSLSSVVGIYIIFNHSKALSRYNLGLLVLGCTGLLISLYTGNQDEGRVARTICDPTQLKTHQNFAYYTLYLYVAFLVFSLLIIRFNKGIMKIIVSTLILLSSLGGITCLVYVGHLGASVVYNQGGGVTVPDEDCSGF